jgi:hypothetical protein
MLVLSRTPTSGVVFNEDTYMVYIGYIGRKYVFELKNWKTNAHIKYVHIPLHGIFECYSGTEVQLLNHYSKFQIRLGFTAPKNVNIVRDELLKPDLKRNRPGVEFNS